MLPIPQLVLFLPICVLGALAITAVAITIITEISASTRTVAKTPAADTSPAPTPGESAQIIYFRPRKTSLRSFPGIDVPQRGHVFN